MCITIGIMYNSSIKISHYHIPELIWHIISSQKKIVTIYFAPNYNNKM